MKMLLPILLAVTGVGAGVGAGVALKPADSEAEGAEHAESDAKDAGAKDADDHGDDHGGDHGDDHGGGDDSTEYAYVSLDNQFIVPILQDTRVRSLVVLSIDLEVPNGTTEAIHRAEPKIRDAFLTVLFDHANAGGFSGTFTSSGMMQVLRTALREAGHKAVGDDVLNDVLITGIVRQDV